MKQSKYIFPLLVFDRSHVLHWAEWALKEFPETTFDPSSNDWDLEGKELCNLSHDDFKAKVNLVQLTSGVHHLVVEGLSDRGAFAWGKYELL